MALFEAHVVDAEGADGKGFALRKQHGATSSKTTHVQLVGMMLTAGLLAGAVAFLYNFAMEFLLEAVWKRGPKALASHFDTEQLERFGWCYTVAATLSLGAAAGFSILFLGQPGDLPEVVHRVHSAGYVPLRQAPSMALSSLFSIAAGGSLGPEAPLVAISSAVCGYVSRHLFGHSPADVRRFTLMGMSAGLSAFFGVTLGGALFALEVCHTMGLQFYEMSVYCAGAGAVCLVVFRSLDGNAEFGAIWEFPAAPPAQAEHVLQGAVIGCIAAAVGLLFAAGHRLLGRAVCRLGLGRFEDTKRPVALCLLGAAVVAAVGVLLPPTMFWSELEMGSLAAPGVPLPHIWPAGGVWGLAPLYNWAGSPRLLLLVGLAKLLAISATVHGGFRGGFIFPLFFAGACLGRALTLAGGPLGFLFARVPPVMACMAFAAGLNVSVTRTPFASALIVTALCGQPEVAAPVLASALTALFLTHGRAFIESQQDRPDVRFFDDLTLAAGADAAEAAEEAVPRDRGGSLDITIHNGSPGGGAVLCSTLDVTIYDGDGITISGKGARGDGGGGSSNGGSGGRSSSINAAAYASPASEGTISARQAQPLRTAFEKSGFGGHAHAIYGTVGDQGGFSVV